MVDLLEADSFISQLLQLRRRCRWNMTAATPSWSRMRLSEIELLFVKSLL
ncbi:hypothetical protein [Methylocella tundrae]|nr:hypothetical protein SIN04_01100 [Methylocella tundrae]